MHPERLPRLLLHEAIRLPLAVVTWLLTQTSAHAVSNLTELVEAAGSEIAETRTALLGSLAAAVARPPDVVVQGEARV